MRVTGYFELKNYTLIIDEIFIVYLLLKSYKTVVLGVIVRPKCPFTPFLIATRVSCNAYIYMCIYIYIYIFIYRLHKLF